MTDRKPPRDLPVNVTGAREGPQLYRCPDCSAGVLVVNDPHGHAPDCRRHHWPKKRAHETDAATEIARVCRERDRERDDLVEAKALLRKAEKALTGAGTVARLGVADQIAGFLDMVRCSECGERIQHAGFLDAHGRCIACTRAEGER